MQVPWGRRRPALSLLLGCLWRLSLMVTSTKCFVLSSCGRKVAPVLGNRGWRKGIAEIPVTSLQCG